MKNERITSHILMVALVLFIFSPMVLSPQQQEDAIDSAIRELTEQLSLTEEQSARIRSVFTAAEEQMNRDRQMFKQNRPQLIENAKMRRDMVDSHIQSVLTQKQIKKYPSVKAILYLENGVVELAETLLATYNQAYLINRFKHKSNEQRAIDRENYDQSAEALISAAKANLTMFDSRVSSILTPDQNQAFFSFKQQRDADRELFQLREGLMLTEEQTAQVKHILDDFHETFESLRKKKGNMQGGMGMGGGSMKGDGDRGGGMMGGGGRGGGMRGGGPGGMRDGQDQKQMQKLQNKKSEAILKILTQNQLVLYQQVMEMQKRQRQDRMKEMRMR